MTDKNSGALRVGQLYNKSVGGFTGMERLAGAGSDREYFRISGSRMPSVIGTYGIDSVENKAFVDLAVAFRKAGANVPGIIAVSDDCSCYLQEDLGAASLLPLLSGDERLVLSAKTLRSLASLQTLPSSVWEDAVVARPFSVRLVLWDLNYFKYEFLKPSGLLFDEELLEDDLQALAKDLSGGDHRLWGFMYRDCQSRNVMIRNGEPWWIDFQGGRKGPMMYDAVSFLWQAKAGFTDEERAHLLGVYADALSLHTGVDREIILAEVDAMAFLRTLQVLGAYGFRGLVERKSHFIESIPAALRNLENLLAKGVADRYSELKRVCQEAVRSRFARLKESDGLTVKVFSFSYKKGYPEDLSGNGGGFMFDCRGMHNPGRYDRYKPLTGLDTEVRDFLKERGEVQVFVERAVQMVSPSIERYLQRGFSSLQVGFGCTGGRHRSVYCAQAFAEEVGRLFPDARIELLHREQGISQFFGGNAEAE